ncbi:hypothetical protein K523DRAFT_99124 [Schizophyllum commune Tattone D]|nr:hypothetical protein K523DRAFT_99124 [Schizophyllum commune Tattone D]
MHSGLFDVLHDCDYPKRYARLSKRGGGCYSRVQRARYVPRASGRSMRRVLQWVASKLEVKRQSEAGGAQNCMICTVCEVCEEAC